MPKESEKLTIDYGVIETRILAYLIDRSPQLFVHAKAVICSIPFHRIEDSTETRLFLSCLENLRLTIQQIDAGSPGLKGKDR